MPDRPIHDDVDLDLLATCAFGLESVVVRELGDLGYEARSVATGRVLFRAGVRAIAEANIHLLAADRVLIRVGQFPVGGGDAGFDALFEGVKALPWERWIARTAAFPVSGRCVRSKLSSEPAVQRATKRAIVDRLKSVYGGSLPETGPKVALEVSLVSDIATLTIDCSGAGLHKRGYREGMPGEAALKETMAAGIVLLSVWRQGRPLMDPFCGSGTIAIEAAMIARGIAPGLHRGFDAEKWTSPAAEGRPLIDPDLWKAVRDEAKGSIAPGPVTPRIIGTDISSEQIARARFNARAAGVEADIEFAVRDFASVASDLQYGCIVTNPPYGVRLGDEEDVERLHRSMPLVFRRLPTWSFQVFTGRLDLERLFNLEATRRRKLYNSKIECCLFTFLGPRPPVAGAANPDESRTISEAHVDASEEPAEHKIAADPASLFGGLGEREAKEAAELTRCLSNSLRHLRKYPSRGIVAYRLYERDVPDVPLIIDRFGDHFHVVETDRVHSRSAAQQADWFGLMRRTIAAAAEVPIDRVHLHESARHRGLVERPEHGSARLIVAEGTPPVRFEVDLNHADAGLRVDLRLLRSMVRERAAEKRVLILFAGTGGFVVNAGAGGATSVVGVDRSEPAIAMARRNLELNGLREPLCRLVCADVFEFLRGTVHGDKFDFAVIDLPLTPDKRATHEERAERQRMLADALGLLEPLMATGSVVYATTLDPRIELSDATVSLPRITAREISRQTVPPEHRNQKAHRCWVLTKPHPSADVPQTVGA